MLCRSITFQLKEMTTRMNQVCPNPGLLDYTSRPLSCREPTCNGQALLALLLEYQLEDSTLSKKSLRNLSKTCGSAPSTQKVMEQVKLT